MVAANQNSADTSRNATLALEILTGPARGTACWLNGTNLDISLDDRDMIRIAEMGSATLDKGVVARLHRNGDSYEIEACADSPLWINGQRMDSRLLEQRDLIEFGESGPLSRYRVHRQGDRLKRSLGDMLADCIDYTRVSRKPRITRLQNAFGDFFRDFVVETTVIFRLIVVLALVALAVIVYQQYRFNEVLQQQAESSSHRLDDFARTLMRTNQELLRPADLNQLRQELRHSLSAAAERLELLEQRSQASIRVIAEANSSIVFLQGAYGFRDIESNRMLRHQTDDDGNSLFNLRGQPLLTLDGEGEVAERPFTGTGFLVGRSGSLLTNRHVALPWEDDTNNESLVAQGMEPFLTRFLGYLPGIESAFAVELVKASDEADLALLRCNEVVEGLPYLRLSVRLPKPGDEVIVMGYPTGIRAMLAQTGDSFLADLQENEALDFWEIAQRLSLARYIRPLASRGIVSQRSEATVVYDADTTHGGSGGPVLDIAGGVIAINAAIIPEYGGSNFGVPVEFARRLLLEAGVDIE